MNFVYVSVSCIVASMADRCSLSQYAVSLLLEKMDRNVTWQQQDQRTLDEYMAEVSNDASMPSRSVSNSHGADA